MKIISISYPILFFGLLLAIPQNAFADEAQNLLEAARGQYQSGHWEKAAMSFEKAYGAADEGSVSKAEAALEWGSLLWEQGDYGAAEVRVKDALERAKTLKLDRAIGQLLLTLGHIEASQKQLHKTKSTLTIYIHITSKKQDRTNQALCRLNRRHVRTLRGQPAGSDAEFRADIAALEQAGTPLSVGTSLAKTAELFQTTGDLGRAIKLLERAGEYFAAAGSVPAIARNKLRIAQLLQEQGRWSEARPHLDGLVGQFEVMGNHPLLINTLGSVARDAQHRGHQAEARALYTRALNIARQTKSPQLIARAHLAICELGEEAAHCANAAKLFEGAGIPALTARAKGQLARHHQGQGEYAPAQKLYLEVIEILEKEVAGTSRDQVSLVTQYANLCQVELSLEATGAYKRCRDALRKMEALNKDWQKKNEAMIAMTYYAVGLAAIKAERYGPAMKSLEKAAELALEMTPPNANLAMQSYLRLGVVQGRLPAHREKATMTFERGLAVSQAAELLPLRIQLRTQLAQFQLNQEAWKQAAETLGVLLEELAKGDDAGTQSWAYSGLARALLYQGKKNKTKKTLKTKLPLAKKSGDEAMIKLFEGNLKKFE